MKKITTGRSIGLLLVMVFAAISMMMITGCAESNNSEVALAVVVGCHGNAPEIPLGTHAIKSTIYNSCYTYGSVAFITDDGNPEVFYQADIPKPEVSGLTKSKKESIANAYAAQLLHELSAAEPKTPEVDTLKAINLAAKTLFTSDGGADKVMVIMDSGLSTAGYLDFTKGLLYAEPDSVVEALRKAEAIPDLTGVSIEWMYCGQTAEPQQELSEKQKNRLQEMWREILEAGGAKVDFLTDISSGITENTYPVVTVVDVADRNIEVVKIENEPVEIIVEEYLDTVVLDNTVLQFVGNQAVFVDPDGAGKIIESYAANLLEHPDNRVYVIGTTASGGKDFCKQLSVDRADTVTDALIRAGVPESQLISMGLGFDDPWHLDDIDDNGNLIEEYACRNRKVLLVDINGPDAKMIQ